MLSSSPLAASNVSPDQSKQTRFTCICCRIKFESATLQRAHFKTEWHLYNLKRRICTLEPIDLESFDEIQAASNAANDAVDDESNFDISSYVELDLNAELKDDDTDIGTEAQDDIDDDEWEKVDPFDDEKDFDENKIEQFLAKIINSDTCLFCDKKSSDMKSNIDHMNAIHGFFIPEIQYVINLEGLMDYLGLKVGAGLTCLWCDKGFSSLQGVQLHMLNKDHCKIFYDQDRAISEFKEYYDYTKQEQIPQKAPDQLDLPRKRRIRRLSDRNSRALVRVQPDLQQGVILLEANQTFSTSSGVKRFNSKRAKELLKLGLTHNNTMRARYRSQNPI